MVQMVNRYTHPERQANSSCVICGRGICRECSNWAAGEIYLCPRYWQENAPTHTTPQKRRNVRLGAELLGLSFGAGLSKSSYPKGMFLKTASPNATSYDVRPQFAETKFELLG